MNVTNIFICNTKPFNCVSHQLQFHTYHFNLQTSINILWQMSYSAICQIFFVAMARDKIARGKYAWNDWKNEKKKHQQKCSYFSLAIRRFFVSAFSIYSIFPYVIVFRTSRADRPWMVVAAAVASRSQASSFVDMFLDQRKQIRWMYVTTWYVI